MDMYPTLVVIRLNITCVAANGYLCLSLCNEKMLEGIFIGWGSLLKLRNITHFSLWENCTSNFHNLTTL